MVVGEIPGSVIGIIMFIIGFYLGIFIMCLLRISKTKEIKIKIEEKN